LILVGNKFNIPAEFPPPQFSNRPDDGLPPFRTLRDAIGNGFVDNDPSVMQFSQRKLKYLAMVPPGGNWRSLPKKIQMESMGKTWFLKGGRSAYWRKLSMDFPCPTVVTMPNHAGTSMCHPTELRALTVGEMAAIQEFPADWKFSGSPTDKCRQVGNAVPVRLGVIAGRAVIKLLDKAKGKRPAKPERGVMVHVRPHVRTRTYFRAGRAFAGDHSYYRGSSTTEQPLLFSIAAASANR
jgi:DNA (cytosine-5)-methyltransferase 1